MDMLPFRCSRSYIVFQLVGFRQLALGLVAGLLWLLCDWLVALELVAREVALVALGLVGGEVATIRPYLSHSAFPAKSCKPC